MKSGKLDTPIDFASDFFINNYHIQYTDLHEIAQGSPLIGYLSINGNFVSKYRFGGPFLFEEPYLYAPILLRSSFLITRIDLRNNELVFIGNLRNYICLEKIEKNKIYFYDSSAHLSLKIFDMNNYKKSDETDTPIHFTHIIHTEHHQIEYKNITEISNEKIWIGNLYINDQPISKHFFGGPLLYTESDIIIPIFVKKLWKIGFKMGLIDLINNEIKIIGERENLISLEKTVDYTIYYHTDLEKKTLYHQQIPHF